MLYKGNLIITNGIDKKKSSKMKCVLTGFYM